MNRSKFSEKGMRFIVEQAEQGAKISDICHLMNISLATFYNWKSKYSPSSETNYKKHVKITQENEKLKLTILQLEKDKEILIAMLKPNIRP